MQIRRTASGGVAVCGAAAAMLLAAVARAGEAPSLPASAPAGLAAASAPLPGGAPGTPASADADPMPSWTLVQLPSDPVPIQGLANFDKVGGGTYSTPYTGGLVGLVGGVIAQAFTSAAVQKSQRNAAQQAADAVLDPYRTDLTGLDVRSVETDALALTRAHASAHLAAPDEARTTDWIVQPTPQFYLTSDASALVLDDVVAVRAPGTPEFAFAQNIRVVMAPRTGDDVQAQWTADHAAGFRRSMAEMLAQSVDVALDRARHPVGEQALPMRTVRFALGQEKHAERGEVLSEDCDWVVLRTLRGAWMAVPSLADAHRPRSCPAVVERPAALPAGAASAAAVPATAQAPASAANPG